MPTPCPGERRERGAERGGLQGRTKAASSCIPHSLEPPFHSMTGPCLWVPFGTPFECTYQVPSEIGNPRQAFGAFPARALVCACLCRIGACPWTQSSDTECLGYACSLFPPSATGRPPRRITRAARSVRHSQCMHYSVDQPASFRRNGSATASAPQRAAILLSCQNSSSARVLPFAPGRRRPSSGVQHPWRRCARKRQDRSVLLDGGAAGAAGRPLTHSGVRWRSQGARRVRQGEGGEGGPAGLRRTWREEG